MSAFRNIKETKLRNMLVAFVLELLYVYMQGLFYFIVLSFRHLETPFSLLAFYQGLGFFDS